MGDEVQQFNKTIDTREIERWYKVEGNKKGMYNDRWHGSDVYRSGHSE